MLGFGLANAQPYRINLAEGSGSTETRHITPGKAFELYVDNRLPSHSYEIHIVRRSIPIPALSMEVDTSGKVVSLEAKEPCAEILELVRSLDTFSEEKDLAAQLEVLRKKLKKAEKDSAVQACVNEHSDFIRARIGLTSSSLGWFNLQRGEELEITIVRTTEGSQKTWTRVYSGGARGEWQTSYGFSFIAPWLNKETVYFASPLDSGYQLKKEANRNKLTFAPSIFFNWMPEQRKNKPWSCGFSGGLGFDLQNPTVFLGPSLSYNQNLKFNFGFVAHKQLVLLGKYSEGQVVYENFTREQMHESLYRMNVYVSLSFRFSQNPFKLD